MFKFLSLRCSLVLKNPDGYGEDQIEEEEEQKLPSHRPFFLSERHFELMQHHFDPEIRKYDPMWLDGYYRGFSSATVVAVNGEDNAEHMQIPESSNFVKRLNEFFFINQVCAFSLD